MSSLLKLLIGFPLVVNSCMHTPKVKRESCEEQLRRLPRVEAHIRHLQGSKKVAGTVLSYTATAAGYATDAVVFVGEGVIKTIVYCPAYAAVMAMGKMPYQYCSPRHTNDFVKGSHFGKTIYRRTKPMRQENFVPLSRAVRRVSACFADRGRRRKAYNQLKVLRESDVFANLPDSERQAIAGELNAYHRGDETPAKD